MWRVEVAPSPACMRGGRHCSIGSHSCHNIPRRGCDPAMDRHREVWAQKCARFAGARCWSRISRFPICHCCVCGGHRTPAKADLPLHRTKVLEPRLKLTNWILSSIGEWGAICQRRARLFKVLDRYMDGRGLGS